MSGIDKEFLFGILSEVLLGNKRPTFSLTERLKSNRRFEVGGKII